MAWPDGFSSLSYSGMTTPWPSMFCAPPRIRNLLQYQSFPKQWYRLHCFPKCIQAFKGVTARPPILFNIKRLPETANCQNYPRRCLRFQNVFQGLGRRCTVRPRKVVTTGVCQLCKHNQLNLVVFPSFCRRQIDVHHAHYAVPLSISKKEPTAMHTPSRVNPVAQSSHSPAVIF